MDSGKNLRLGILEKDANNYIINLFSKHNWECKIENRYERGEYLIIILLKGKISFKIAFLYSSATENSIYKKIDNEVDEIITNGDFYHIDSYAHGIDKSKLHEKKSIQSVLHKWNGIATNGKISFSNTGEPRRRVREFSNIIQSEDPLKQIWNRIRQFNSKELSKVLILERIKKLNINLDESIINKKAEGFTYCIQNACDYFELANQQKLNQKIVSLYYGGIALASAEMLISPSGPASLDEVESMTKFGHGLFTYDALTENSFEDFIIGVLSNGFYKKWVDFLGHDTSNFPQKKPKKESDIDLNKEENITLIELFSRIPELEDLFYLVTQSPTNWLQVSYEVELNGVFGDKNPNESYIKLLDTSYSKNLQDIEKLNEPFFEIEYLKSNKGIAFKTLVKHPGHKYWHEAIKIHSSPYTSSTVLFPIFKTVDSYRAISIAILYSLSILVRYRPSIWREVLSGKHDKYLVLTEEFLSVYERLIPQEFLTSFLDKKVYVTQSGSMMARI